VPEPAVEPAAELPSSEDILTPFHKALRSMIYTLGARLQTTDFSDRTESERLLTDLEYEFGTGVPAACLLCLLHAHAGHEEVGAFPLLRGFDATLIDELQEEHREFERRLGAIRSRADELRATPSAEERVALGKAVCLEVNDFFARYLAHMNREEHALVPLMNRHLTDREIRELRDRIELAMPRERYGELLRWMLRSMNASELTDALRGLKERASPETFARFTRLAEGEVDRDRWAVVRTRVPLAPPTDDLPSDEAPTSGGPPGSARSRL
jgi:Hemerythrin HHE cation binding domain